MNPKESKKMSGLSMVALFIVVYLFAKAWPGVSSSFSSNSSLLPRTNVTTSNANTVNNMNALDLPPNGDTHYYQQAEAVAPLKITTQASANYFIKLVDKNTGKLALTIFIRGGQSVNTKVPLGTYEFRYACGTNWYGEEQLFGPGTVCEKADKIFDFYHNGSQITGHTVTLVKQANGNLPTSTISKDNF